MTQSPFTKPPKIGACFGHFMCHGNCCSVATIIGIIGGCLVPAVIILGCVWACAMKMQRGRAAQEDNADRDLGIPNGRRMGSIEYEDCNPNTDELDDVVVDDDAWERWV